MLTAKRTSETWLLRSSNDPSGCASSLPGGRAASTAAWPNPPGWSLKRIVPTSERAKEISQAVEKEGAAMYATNLLVPTYKQMLSTLSGWLDKAQAQMPEGRAEALLAARLAPDMFPLSTQIRFACVQAQEGVFRLKRENFPVSISTLLDEGRNAGERPGSIADAQARIATTIALLDSLAPGALDADPEQPIAHALPNGMIFDLTPEQYARDWTLPQFYFHLMIAYALLRREGVELGKADYVAHMFAYLRPGTMPSG